MYTIKQIEESIESDEALKLVASVYVEVAATKLKNIRYGIERNRQFFAEVNNIFHILRFVAKQRKIKGMEKKTGSLHVLLTSNNRFYGSLENTLIRFFIENSTKQEALRLIVGKTGILYLQTIRPDIIIQPFLLTQDLPGYTELKNISTVAQSYEQVFMYYSRFKTVLSQVPQVTEVSTSVLNIPEEEAKAFHYFIEPELPRMLEFFDRQILSLLVEQVFFEAELARTAARLTVMDQAQVNADSIIQEEKLLLRLARRDGQNKKLLEMITGVLSIDSNNHGR